MNNQIIGLSMLLRNDTPHRNMITISLFMLEVYKGYGNCYSFLHVLHAMLLSKPPLVYYYASVHVCVLAIVLSALIPLTEAHTRMCSIIHAALAGLFILLVLCKSKGGGRLQLYMYV